MASPRRRKLRKLLRAGLLKAAEAAEAAAEANMYNSVGQVVGGIGKLIGS